MYGPMIPVGPFEVPAADSADNLTIRDVLGNKDDTLAGTSLIAHAKHIVEHAEHVPGFTGNIFYVDAAQSDDTGDGHTPSAAKKTLSAAEAAASAGDAISIKSGSYTEDVTANLLGLELWAEIGARLIGTLTVSADSCRVRGLEIAPSSAVGLALTGHKCAIEDVHVTGTPTTAFDIDGHENIVERCSSIGHTVTAFDIASYNNDLYRCIANGADGATRGFYFSNAAADECVLDDCVSIGNATAGYHIVAGVINCAVVHCSSGSGDGKWIDVDHNSTFLDFTYDNVLHNVHTLTGSGATVTTNLFQFYGAVEVSHIYGSVETQLGADIDDVHLNVYDGTNTVQLTKSTTLDIDAAPVDSLLHKISDAAAVLSYLQADQVRIYEDATKFGVDRVMILNAKNGVSNYIRFTYTTADTPTSGVIDWHLEWKPLDDAGFVKTV